MPMVKIVTLNAGPNGIIEWFSTEAMKGIKSDDGGKRSILIYETGQGTWEFKIAMTPKELATEINKSFSISVTIDPIKKFNISLSGSAYSD